MRDVEERKGDILYLAGESRVGTVQDLDSLI